ncbi:MAG: biotin--[acetyl-CoA-carboxylase] ligase [Nitrososphaeraceae archaeon]
MNYEILELDHKNMLIGKEIRRYKKISSTQDLALFLINNSKETGNSHHNGLVIVSDEQTAGKGRAERKWVSNTGGLWFSIMVIKPNIPASNTNLIQMLSATSVCETINALTNLNAKIKWPNDILINSKKVAGILLDVGIKDSKIDYLVIGIGINVNTNSIATRNELEKKRKYEHENTKKTNNHLTLDVTSLKDELNNQKLDKLKILKDILEKIEFYLFSIEQDQESLYNANMSILIEKYKSFCETLGKRICIYDKGEIRYCGFAKEIDDDGSLVIERNEGGRIVVDKVFFGDVSLREI